MKFEFEVRVTGFATAVVEADSIEEARDKIRDGQFEITEVITNGAYGPSVSENDRLNAADDLTEDLHLPEEV
jgi:hypothetical protein